MTFSIGQIVELFDSIGLYKVGDRGTVIEMIGYQTVKISMHKTCLQTHIMYVKAHCLRHYVNPLDVPGRNKRSYETMQALSIVLQEETPHAMQDVCRELERARMTAEDYSEGNSRMSPNGLTWRMRKQIYGRIIINQSTTLVQIKDTVKDRFNGYVSDHECIAQIRESIEELDDAGYMMEL